MEKLRDLAERLHASSLGSEESLVDTDRKPGMPLGERAAHANDGHDWKDTRATKIVFLDRLVIREEPRNIGRPAPEAGWRPRPDDPIDLALLEHVGESTVVGDLSQLDLGRQRDGSALAASRDLDAAATPFDVARMDAMFVLQDAPDPDVGGRLILWHADHFADEIFGTRDAAVGANVDAAVAEQPGHEGGHTDVGSGAARHRHHVAAERDLRDVEFLTFERAVRGLFWLQRHGVDLAALDRHASVKDRAGAIIGPDRDAQLQHEPRPLFPTRLRHLVGAPDWVSSAGRVPVPTTETRLGPAALCSAKKKLTRDGRRHCMVRLRVFPRKDAMTTAERAAAPTSEVALSDGARGREAPAVKAKASVDRLLNTLYLLASLVLLALAWKFVSWIVGADVLPGPWASIAAVEKSQQEGYLWSDNGITAYRIAGAFVIALVASLVIGALLGRPLIAERLFGPWVTIGASIPSLVIIVVVYLAIGINDQAAMIGTAIIVAPAMIYAVWDGVRAINPELQEMARAFAVPKHIILRRVILPQTAPFIVTAARTGLSLTWRIMIFVELLGRSSRVGYRIQYYYNLVDMNRVAAAAVPFIGLMLAFEFGVLRPFERWVFRWRRSEAS